jgi:Uma2 family endonuclease
MNQALSELTKCQPSAEPAWEVALLFPNQGTWSPEEYLELKGNRLVEFSHGNIEVLTMPTTTHQLIVLFLLDALRAYVAAQKLGMVLMAPLRVQLSPHQFREPDVVFMLAQHTARIGEEFWEGADLVMEVVSPDDPRRDLEIKRHEYAVAGIPEYWIVDPRDGRITVLRLDGEHYVVHGEFTRGMQATSAMLSNFSVDVTAVFAVRE